jgi:hypothetical protein
LQSYCAAARISTPSGSLEAVYVGHAPAVRVTMRFKGEPPVNLTDFTLNRGQIMDAIHTYCEAHGMALPPNADKRLVPEADGLALVLHMELQ